MFSKKSLTKLIFYYFYIVFYYSWLLELQLNQYNLFLFLRSFICQVLFFGVSEISFKIFVQSFVDLCVSYLLDQRSLILKLVLGCDWKLSVGHIQTGHAYFLPVQVCGRLCQGWRFFLFHLLQSIHLLASRQFLKFAIFWWIFVDWFINITEYCSLCWVYIFINIAEDCFFCLGSRFINITEYCSFYWGYR